MAYLPLANLLHHKLRSALSALGIGIGICMLLTLSGLSRGSLNEIADRWDAVDADLIVFPQGMGESASLSGVGISDKYVGKLTGEYGDIVAQAVPVFLWPIKVGGQDHIAAGVNPAQIGTLTGSRTLTQGRVFDPNGDFARYLEGRLLGSGDDAAGDPNEDLLRPGGLEMVIDSRLAAKAKLQAGDMVHTANHDWRIVGVMPDGGMSRVYLPRRTAQFLFGSGSIARSTVIFVKLRPGVDADAAARRLAGLKQEVIHVRQYRDMLQQKWGLMYIYVDAVNAVALVISFLFIMITLYTMVLQRTREIAILKSFGAGWPYIGRMVLAESLMLTAAGMVFGAMMSVGATWAFGKFTLLTVKITPTWIAITIASAALGAIVSGLYPAWRATRVDMVQALTLE